MTHHARLIAALFVATMPAAAQQAGPSYVVSFPSLLEARVHLELAALPPSLYMLTGGTGKDDGFASYVHDLAIRCGAQSLSASRVGGVWTIAGSAPGGCSVDYGVHLSFTSEHWEVGNEQAGFTDGSGSFVVSKALFLESDAPGTRRISFAVPRGWQLETPWIAERDGSFLVAKDAALADLVAFGRLAVGHSTSGSFRVSLVTFGALSHQQSAVMRTMDRVASNFNGVFPPQSPSRYLVVLIPGGEADGEAYQKGFASTLQAPLLENEKIVWANGLAHELFHHWNGQQIRADTSDTELEWLTEGFTEYFANMALARTGEVTTDTFLQKVASNVGQYEYFLASGLFNDVTLRAAGARKGRYRFGVYPAGWVVAFVLDQELRHDGKRLEDVMRALLVRSATGPLTVAAVLATIEDVGGKRIRDLADRGISTRTSLDPAHYLRALGINVAGQSYADEYYLHIDPHATTAQRATRRAWAGF